MIELVRAQDLPLYQGRDREDAVAPFPQPFWEMLLSFAVAFIPIAVVVWDHQAATTVELETQALGQQGT